MKRIRVKKIEYSWNQLDNDCRSIVIGLKKKGIVVDNVYGVPRGGLVPAVIISHLLNKPLLINRDFITPRTLVVDDISDSGTTLHRILLECRNNPPTATLWVDEETKIVPTVYCNKKTKKEWIVYPFETLKTSKLDN